MNSISFYQRHLDQVSRSFAFCIVCLEEDLRFWVSISYLICRILDTVEDAPWSDQNLKLHAFEEFQDFMRLPPSANRVSVWVHSFPREIPKSEQDLLNDALLIFEDFHGLAPGAQSKIRRGVLNMSRGMVYFSRSDRSRLKNMAEVNQYCFFVAGVVGEVLTDLQAEKLPFLNTENIYLLSHHFGIFLQKINLLKDQFGDEKEGRFLVPSRPQLLISLARNAKYSLEYIQSIPVQASGYRLFCSWSFFLGVYSLDWIQKSWAMKVIDKIPRMFTQQLMEKIQSIIDDNAALERLFKERFSIEALTSPPESQTNDLPWFHDIYEGNLDTGHLAGLGML